MEEWLATLVSLHCLCDPLRDIVRISGRSLIQQLNTNNNGGHPTSSADASVTDAVANGSQSSLTFSNLKTIENLRSFLRISNQSAAPTSQAKTAKEGKVSRKSTSSDLPATKRTNSLSQMPLKDMQKDMSLNRKDLDCADFIHLDHADLSSHPRLLEDSEVAGFELLKCFSSVRSIHYTPISLVRLDNADFGLLASIIIHCNLCTVGVLEHEVFATKIERLLEIRNTLSHLITFRVPPGQFEQWKADLTELSLLVLDDAHPKALVLENALNLKFAQELGITKTNPLTEERLQKLLTVEFAQSTIQVLGDAFSGMVARTVALTWATMQILLVDTLRRCYEGIKCAKSNRSQCDILFVWITKLEYNLTRRKDAQLSEEERVRLIEFYHAITGAEFLLKQHCADSSPLRFADKLKALFDYARELKFSDVNPFDEDDCYYQEDCAFAGVKSAFYNEFALSDASFQYTLDPRQQPKLLGNGTFGRVVLGTYNGRQVAAKELVHGTYNLAELEQEILSRGSLCHPNVLRVLGFFVDTLQSAHIVMEYTPNGTLHNLVFKSTVPTTKAELLSVLQQVIGGMLYLHALKPHPVLHTDLRPANILLDADWNARISGFGFSSMRRPDGPLQFTPSLRYCAPELFQINSQFTQATDIYAFGVTVFEVATGSIPFQSLNELSHLQQGKVFTEAQTIGDNELRALACSTLSPDPKYRLPFNKLNSLFLTAEQSQLAFDVVLQGSASAQLAVDNTVIVKLVQQLKNPSAPIDSTVRVLQRLSVIAEMDVSYCLLIIDACIVEIFVDLWAHPNPALQHASVNCALSLVGHHSSRDDDTMLERIRLGFCSPHVCLAFVDLLKSPDQSLRLKIVKVLRYLTVTEKSIQLLSNANALPVLVRLMKTGIDEIAIEVAAIFLNLAERSNYLPVVAKADVIQPLLRLFPVITDAGRAPAAQVLFCLARRAESSKRIVSERGFESVVDLLAVGSGHPIETVATLLRKLHWNAVTREAIVKSGAVTALVKLLLTDEDENVEYAALTLAHFAESQNKENKQSDLPFSVGIEQSGGIPALVQVLQSKSTKASRRAAEALSHLALVPGNAIRIVEAGAVPSLVQLLSAKSKETVKTAISALLNLLDAQVAAQIVVEMGAVAPLVQLLSSNQPQTAIDSARLLSELSRLVDIQKSVMAADGVKALVKMLSVKKDSDLEECKSSAAVALGNLVSHPKNKETVTAISEADGLKKLLNLLLSDHDEVVRCSAEALAKLLSTKDTIHFLNSAGGVQSFVAALQAADEKEADRLRYARGLRALAAQNNAVISMKLNAANAFEALVAVVASSSSPLLVAVSLETLALLTANAEMRVKFNEAHGLQIVFKYLSSMDEQLRQSASTALLMLAGQSAVLKQIVNEEKVSQLVLELESTKHANAIANMVAVLNLLSVEPYNQISTIEDAGATATLQNFLVTKVDMKLSKICVEDIRSLLMRLGAEVPVEQEEKPAVRRSRDSFAEDVEISAVSETLNTPEPLLEEKTGEEALQEAKKEEVQLQPQSDVVEEPVRIDEEPVVQPEQNDKKESAAEVNAEEKPVAEPVQTVEVQYYEEQDFDGILELGQDIPMGNGSMDESFVTADDDSDALERNIVDQTVAESQPPPDKVSSEEPVVEDQQPAIEPTTRSDVEVVDFTPAADSVVEETPALTVDEFVDGTAASVPNGLDVHHTVEESSMLADQLAISEPRTESSNQSSLPEPESTHIGDTVSSPTKTEDVALTVIPALLAAAPSAQPNGFVTSLDLPAGSQSPDLFEDVPIV